MATRPYTTPARSGTTRRAALSLAGAFSAVGITAGAVASVADLALSPAHQDAELLRLCSEFHRLTALIKADPGGGDWETALAQRDRVQAALEQARPATETGRRAMADVALAIYDENSPEDEREASDVHRFVWATLTVAAGRA